MNWKNLPYNLIKNYPTENHEINIIAQRILHNDSNIWDKFEKYGLKYSKTENNKYFPINIEIIGLGAYSIIYQIQNSDYVLKITNEEYEYNWNKKIFDLQSTNEIYLNTYVKIYDIIKSNIKSNYLNNEKNIKENCSFILLEKLEIISDNELNKIYELNKIFFEKTNYYFTDEWINPEIINNFIIEEENNIKLTDNLKDFLNKIIQLNNDKENYGWFDFHFQNLMKNKNNNYKIIDLMSN